MMPAKVVRDSCDNLTVLYYMGCQQAFKFFGDDPEEHKVFVKDEHTEMICQMFPDHTDLPWEFLNRFYLHSRCLLFTSGIWMSETARYPQYLRYKPGANTSFRISGMTRFTALTNNCGAICVGINPDGTEFPNLRRFVHRMEGTTMWMPQSPQSYIVPTQNCTYGKYEIGEGEIKRAKIDFDELTFEEPGYLIEFVNEPLTLEDELINYAHQWVDNKIEVFTRDSVS
tara:strand:- start:434 stop:1114 length:681 start_codon:yes stop_codon:yes gene_type:complete